MFVDALSARNLSTNKDKGACIAFLYSSPVVGVVQELLGLLLEAEDAGDASCGPAPLLDDAVAALTLAFRAPARGGLAAAETANCLRRLVSASRASAASRRLTLLVSKTLSEREEGELGEFTELVAPTSAALLQELLAAGEAGEADEAWLVLSRLLSRAGFEQTAGILSRGWPFGASGAKAGAAGWVCGLLQAAEGLERPALELLSSVRRALRGADPAARLLPEGVVSAAELHENAVITGLVLMLV
ncbi:unnamed protein product [Symbiodinium sp. CCMP2456]|nr:unnamed protein product [Symbiodinium sp. CCMP2456]